MLPAGQVLAQRPQPTQRSLSTCAKHPLYTLILLLAKLGGEWRWSRNRATPDILVAKWFRFGFLCFFMAMFGNMLWQTYLVAAQAESLREVVTLLWTFKLPWAWALGLWCYYILHIYLSTLGASASGTDDGRAEALRPSPSTASSCKSSAS